MRYAPAAIAISLLAAVTSSASLGAGYDADPRAVALVEEGRIQMEAGDTQGAIDSFEAALVVDPGYSDIYLDLAEVARIEGLQGKAIHFYREAQARDPENLAAISGEGEALVEKGALANAQRNLERLEDLCGSDCMETLALAAAIDRGPSSRVLTAEAVAPDSAVTQN